MADELVTVAYRDDRRRVLLWREEQLEKAGLDEVSALLLASVPDLDWHRVAELARRGVSARVLLDLYGD